MANKSKKAWKDHPKWQRVTTYIVLGVLGFIILSMVVAATTTETKTNKNTTTTQGAVAESKAEEYCQDAALLGQHVDLDKISIIDASNYDKHYVQDGYDKEGDPMNMLRWNGELKDTGGQALFTCWISGPEDSIQLHWLTMNGTDLVGSAEFESYDKDGKLRQ